MNSKARAEFNVRGLVQGVGFRYFVWRNANDLGLTGYTRNEYDGSVYVAAEGDRDKLELLHKILGQGPSRARVDGCSVIYLDFRGEFSDFDIR